MKTKNQTEQDLLELAVAKAANEEGYGAPRNSSMDHKQAWCPADVWRTRVKNSAQRPIPESAPL